MDSTLDINVASRALASLGLPPDFESSMPLNYIHKRLNAADVYFVANPTPHAVEPLCTFRLGDRQPELWWPDTGRVEDARAWERTGDGRIRLAIPLDPEGSVFVVFRKKAGSPPSSRTGGNGLKFDVLDELQGPWEVRFPSGWGAPSYITLDRLLSWSEHADPGVKYFSGTATYVKNITIPPDACGPGSRLYLDLGRVAVMAEVIMNGRNLGVLWKRPFHIDITEAAQPGVNMLEIKVVNLWINRMIGDEHLPEDSARNANGTLKEWPTWLDGARPSPTGRFTFTSWRLWKKDDPLVESGLLGPVVLKRACENIP
jgi:hypothetical protein